LFQNLILNISDVFLSFLSRRKSERKREIKKRAEEKKEEIMNSEETVTHRFFA
jgi:hypothetical protein